MKIVTVTMVRNEQDIIETFVRYHEPLVNEMVILDNGSSDQTSDILWKLKEEGLKIQILFDPETAFLQSEMVTKMVRNAFLELNASLVIPLDADEFIASNLGGIKRESLENLPYDKPVYLEWLTYVPQFNDCLAELNPLIRIQHRRSVQHNHDSKIMIPISVFESMPNLTVSQGSHYLINEEGKRLASNAPSEDLVLLHFPIRSANQMCSKYLIGWLSNLARPERVLFDWLPIYNLVKQNVPTNDEISKAALFYNVLDKNILIDIVKVPVDLSHLKEKLELKYTPSSSINVLKNVLNYAEELADNVSLVLGRSLLGNEDLSDKQILKTIGEYRTIDGWLSVREAILLYRVVTTLPNVSPIVCEIGSWMGRSSFVLACALKLSTQNGLLYCIDPLDGSGDKTSALIYQSRLTLLEETLENRFWKNMRRLGVDKNIKLVSKLSIDAEAFVPDDLDFLFIDGDHSLESVTNDFFLYAPKVRRGGYIALHDVGSTQFNGPKTVVEKFIVSSSDWESHILVDELFVARRSLK